jgi:hypothetical protein
MQWGVHFERSINMTRAVLFLLVAGCHHNHFEGSLTSDPDSDAISRAEHFVSDPSCLSFLVAGHEADVTEIEVREKHDDHCGGDPQVAPVAKRLRVHASGTVEGYDAVTDTWK